MEGMCQQAVMPRNPRRGTPAAAGARSRKDTRSQPAPLTIDVDAFAPEPQPAPLTTDADAFAPKLRLLAKQTISSGKCEASDPNSSAVVRMAFDDGNGAV